MRTRYPVGPCRVMATSTSHLHIAPLVRTCSYLSLPSFLLVVYGYTGPPHHSKRRARNEPSFMSACVRHQCASVLAHVRVRARTCARLRERMTKGCKRLGEGGGEPFIKEGGCGRGKDRDGWQVDVCPSSGRACSGQKDRKRPKGGVREHLAHADSGSPVRMRHVLRETVSNSISPSPTAPTPPPPRMSCSAPSLACTPALPPPLRAPTGPSAAAPPCRAPETPVSGAGTLVGSHLAPSSCLSGVASSSPPSPPPQSSSLALSPPASE